MHKALILITGAIGKTGTASRGALVSAVRDRDWAENTPF